MAGKFLSEQNIKFLLYDVFQIESFTQYERYKDHNRKSFDLILKAAVQLSKSLLFPVFEEMDRKPPELIDGNVIVHPEVRTILKEFGDGGWISAPFDYDQGGEQLPYIISEIAQYIFCCANYSANAYLTLSNGAAGLLVSFGSTQLQQTYLPKMFSGQWQGTMALTEPEAGSSLADITTTATPTDKEYYKISGQKIFISAADHNGAENIVHLMLAKIEGAPAGVKGISLFVVPKKRLTKEGDLVANDVKSSGIYHKLGIRGCPIVQLSMGDNDDCRGYLVGEPHNGLRYMFQMMNEARLNVGLGAVAMSTAAYYASLDYAKTRKQGRLSSDKDPRKPQTPIIQHADIKRMLLFQRAVSEGGLSLIMQCATYVDHLRMAPDRDREKYELLLDILTPVAKTYPSEMGIQSISQGLQCLGGSGYVDDYPLEQYYRDVRIHPIHEGTTGIQAIDLLGRKMAMKGGKSFDLLKEEINRTISAAESHSCLAPQSQKLTSALEKLDRISNYLFQLNARYGPEVFLADATLYLELFGIITIAWQWLKQAVVIQNLLQKKNVSKSQHQFFNGKIAAMRFYFSYELPKILGLEDHLMTSDRLTTETQLKDFVD